MADNDKELCYWAKRTTNLLKACITGSTQGGDQGPEVIVLKSNFIFPDQKFVCR